MVGFPFACVGIRFVCGDEPLQNFAYNLLTSVGIEYEGQSRAR